MKGTHITLATVLFLLAISNIKCSNMGSKVAKLHSDSAKQVVIILAGPLENDRRVLTESWTLHSEGWSVTIIALPPRGGRRPKDDTFPNVMYVSISPDWGSLKGLERLISYGHFLSQATRHVLKINPDVIHCHDIQALPVGMLTKFLRPRAKLIYDAHEFWIGKIQHRGAFLRSFLKMVEWVGSKQATSLITVSDDIADLITRIYKVQRPIVLRNIFDSPMNSNHPYEINGIRDALGIDNAIPIVLYQGGIKPGRGLSTLVRAMKYVQSDSVVAFLGGGPQRKELETLARSEQVLSRIYFHDPVPPGQLVRFSASASVGVMPIRGIHLSYYYSLPNKLFEYIHSGLPIAASDLPEIRRLIEQYDIGSLFDPEDPKDVAHAIDEILSDPKCFAQYKANVQKAARALNWENERKKLLFLYNQMDFKG